MPKFQREHKIVEAVQYTGRNQNKIADFYPDVCGSFGSPNIWIQTHHGLREAEPGDWVIKDEDEYYPCKPDKFAQDYRAL